MENNRITRRGWLTSTAASLATLAVALASATAARPVDPADSHRPRRKSLTL